MDYMLLLFLLYPSHHNFSGHLRRDKNRVARGNLRPREPWTPHCALGNKGLNGMKGFKGITVCLVPAYRKRCGITEGDLITAHHLEST